MAWCFFGEPPKGRLLAFLALKQKLTRDKQLIMQQTVWSRVLFEEHSKGRALAFPTNI
jgi:hypothetical protein